MKEVQRGDRLESISQRNPHLKTDVPRAPASPMDFDTAADAYRERAGLGLSSDGRCCRSKAEDHAADHGPIIRSYQSNRPGQ